jgi:hypothetical protein
VETEKEEEAQTAWERRTCGSRRRTSTIDREQRRTEPNSLRVGRRIRELSREETKEEAFVCVMNVLFFFCKVWMSSFKSLYWGKVGFSCLQKRKRIISFSLTHTHTCCTQSTCTETPTRVL